MPEYCTEITRALIKRFRADRVLWYMVGFSGVCHFCDSRMSAPFKFYNHKTGELEDGDVAFQFCFPLVCSYCGGKHYNALLFSKESLARRNEICRLAH